MRRRRYSLVAWSLLLVLFLLASGVTVPPRQGVADPEDQGRFGTASLAEVLSASAGDLDILSLSPGLVEHGPAELAVIVGPERALYGNEEDRLNGFMEDGGTLLVFLSSTIWNDFLAPHGVNVNGSLLIPTVGGGSERLLELDLPADLGGGQLLLANATTLTDPGPDVQQLSPDQDMVLDIDGNGEIRSPPDKAGTFPVLARTDVGGGQLIIITSVESVLGGDISRNQAALTNLIEAVAQGGVVALDVGTHPQGWNDLARAPSQALLSLVHVSIGGLLVALAAGALLVIVHPKRRETSVEHDPLLDQPTDVTREVVDRAGA